ncbi:hypothetical protein DI392_10565 [Vibrio albus]|uniref:Uncharacterized protein n=1 Tax=Vibrio albus TaxID=2200953 RepID=A0A2U3B943_9VIBR|nr:hypothetical protein [Vibrio albus]PWI33291.1 hypothetical protein DI392_10565 [Vibrio albus]
MSLQLAFLLTFIAGGLSVWVLMRMSKQAENERMNIIEKHINALGGTIISIELINRKNCPFSSEYHDPDLVYKFYKVSYDLEHELKECWTVLEMKQRSYGPGGAIDAKWVWRDL